MSDVSFQTNVSGHYQVASYTWTILNQIITVDPQILEDDLDTREQFAVAVDDGALTATYAGVLLTGANIRSIDKATEEIDNAAEIVKGIAPVAGVLFYDASWTTPRGAYVPSACVEDNVNLWITNVTTTGFKVNFSAAYTGNVYWSAE